MSTTTLDLHEHSSTELPERPRRMRRLRSFGIVVLAVAGLLLGVTGIANAASWSPYYPPQTHYVGDCTVEVGPVYGGTGAWAVFGGVYVHCAHNHATLAVSVKEVWSPDNRSWYYEGQAGSAVGHYINGWNGIITTSGLCGGGYWFTRAWISIDGVSYQPADSLAHGWIHSGC